MTDFDLIGEAVYDGGVRLPLSAIKRSMIEMELAFPIKLVAAKPPTRKMRIPQGLHHQKYFLHLHQGLIYILWKESPQVSASLELRGWVCGEAQVCERAEYFINRLQNAILAFRQVELDAVIGQPPLLLSFAAELDSRRLAIARVQEAMAKRTFDEDAWRNALDVWLQIILLRYQKHLNTLHRKMDEFLSSITASLDVGNSLSNCFCRLQRELYQIYSLSELRERFPSMIIELSQEIPSFAILSHKDVSDISRQALEWMEAHYNEPVTVAQCAAAIPVSAAYLCRLLQKETGLSPVQHLQQKRVSHAKVLLHAKRLTIAEVSQRCGFGSTEHFYRVFRQYTGLTPAAYRRNAE